MKCGVANRKASTNWSDLQMIFKNIKLRVSFAPLQSRVMISRNEQQGSDYSWPVV